MPLLPTPLQRIAGAQDEPAPKLAAVVHRAGSPTTLPHVPGVKKIGRKMALPAVQGSAKLPLGVQPSKSAPARCAAEHHCERLRQEVNKVHP